MIEKLAGGNFTLNDGVKHYLSCYGYVDGRLYIGSRHHMGIMEFLLSHGYTFETLMAASQAWGWLENAPEEEGIYYPDKARGPLQIRFSTDAAAIDFSLEPEVCAAFEKALGYPTVVTSKSKPTNQNEYAPMYETGYGSDSGYWKNQGPIEGCYVYDTHDGFLGWVNSTDLSHQFPPPEKKPEEQENEQLPLFDHPVPGGGTPPPKKLTQWVVELNHDNGDIGTYTTAGPVLDEQAAYQAAYNYLTHMGEEDQITFGKAYPKTSSWIEVEDLWYDDGDVEEDFLALPQIAQHTSSGDDTRIVWLVGMDGQARFGKPGEHHIDIGWSGNDEASGDIRFGHGQTILRVLEYEPHVDFEYIIQVVRQKWDQISGIPITSVVNSTYPGLTNEASYDILGAMTYSSESLTDPEITHGWEVRQMESGEYEHHHAIVIDRKNHRLYINYNGHHGPLIDAAVNGNGVPYHDFMDTTMGHYRLEPSTTENFQEGWGFHGGSGKADELEAIAHHMRIYHNVNDLEDAWVSNKVATVKWLNVCPNVWTMSVKWKAVYDKAASELYIWKTCGDNGHHADSLNDFFPGKVFKTGNIKKNSGLVQAEGTYLTPSFVIAPGSTTPKKDVEKVKKLLAKALEEKFPTSNLEYVDDPGYVGEFVI